MSFIINNQEVFQTNSSIYNINTGNEHGLFCFQKSTFWAGTKIFNDLPPSMKIFQNDKAK